jgi:glyoxylase-like metal-dependent hydrolase (beta-lactamase superfamily II)
MTATLSLPVQPPAVEYAILDTGYCLASESHMLSGGARREIHCHATVALLHHPTQGYVLWDTGYAPRMLDVTRRFPFSLYARITPLRLDPALALVNQLTRLQVAPADIQWIILSHFHADHIAGLLDFPQARILCSAEAYQAVAAARGFSALRKAFIPALMPMDFASRARMLEDFSGATLPFLGPTVDLFDDGALLAVRLPGHARGQIGVLVNSTRGPVLLAADSCWLSRSYRERRAPPRIANLILDDPRATRKTIDALHVFAVARPNVNIIPTHCPDAFRRETGKDA